LHKRQEKQGLLPSHFNINQKDGEYKKPIVKEVPRENKEPVKPQIHAKEKVKMNLSSIEERESDKVHLSMVEAAKEDKD
jgi:hypothetical protein